MKEKIKRHNFNKGVSLHLSCGNDDFRPIMQNVLFENGFAIASDGHIMVKACMKEISNLSEEEIKLLNGKFIHREQFKEIVKANVISIQKDGITAHYEYSEVKFKFQEIKEDGKLIRYPNYQKILDRIKNNPIKEICISPYLLQRLCSSINADSVRLSFNDRANGIKVEFSKYGEVLYNSIGLIMPLRE